MPSTSDAELTVRFADSISIARTARCRAAVIGRRSPSIVTDRSPRTWKSGELCPTARASPVCASSALPPCRTADARPSHVTVDRIIVGPTTSSLAVTEVASISRISLQTPLFTVGHNGAHGRTRAVTRRRSVSRNSTTNCSSTRIGRDGCGRRRSPHDERRRPPAPALTTGALYSQLRERPRARGGRVDLARARRTSPTPRRRDQGARRARPIGPARSPAPRAHVTVTQHAPRARVPRDHASNRRARRSRPSGCSGMARRLACRTPRRATHAGAPR